MQYSQEFDEKLPPAENGTPEVPYPVLIKPYLQDAAVYKCPSNTLTLKFRNSGNLDFAHYYVNGGGGRDNDVTDNAGNERNRPMNPAGVGATDSAAALSEIKSPPQCILVGDSKKNRDEATFSGVSDIEFQGHLGTTNFLFADGHVKSMRPTLTVQGTNMWDIDNTKTPNATWAGKMGTETTSLAN